MADIRRMFIFIGLAALLSSCLFIAGFALPDQMHKETGYSGPMSLGLPREPMPDPAKGTMAELFSSGRGFALKGNESHNLRFDVESIRYIEPMDMRMLLESNKSLDEIKQEIEAKEGNITYRGRIMLDGEIYPLLEIMVGLSGDNTTTIDADVEEPSFGEKNGDETIAIGHITVTTYPSKIDSIGKGRLSLNFGQYSGSYNVLLNMMPSQKGRKGRIAPGT
jgi:hypothetical protein